jgi:hypothetical protein
VLAIGQWQKVFAIALNDWQANVLNSRRILPRRSLNWRQIANSLTEQCGHKTFQIIRVLADCGRHGSSPSGRKMPLCGSIKKVQKRSNKGIFPCNQWRRVWSVPSGFNELHYIAEMAWKRSSVRSRSGPPINQQLSGSASPGLVAFGSKFSKPFCERVLKSLALLLSCNMRRSETLLFLPPDPILFAIGRDVFLLLPDPPLFGLGLFISSRWIESIVPRTPSGISCM